MAESNYYINPDELDENSIYLSTYNAALIGLMGKRTWSWLSNPANWDELTDLAIGIVAVSVPKSRVILRQAVDSSEIVAP